jgi:hypothetical protein
MAETVAQPDGENEEKKRQELQTALAGVSETELREMGARLAKSLAQLADYQEELQAEQQALTEEGSSLRSTIELMLMETHKLNICGDNTVDPTLQEGPLEFVGRFWEMMRPRDNQVLISPNIGELKRQPTADEQGSILNADSEVVKELVALRDAAAEQLGGLEEVATQATKQIEDLHSTAEQQFQDMHKTASEKLLVAQATLTESAAPIKSQAETLGQDLHTSITSATAPLREQSEQLRETVVPQIQEQQRLIQEQAAVVAAPLLEKTEQLRADLAPQIREHHELLRKQSIELHSAATEHLSVASKSISAATDSFGEMVNSNLSDEHRETLNSTKEKMNAHKERLSGFFSTTLAATAFSTPSVWNPFAAESDTKATSSSSGYPREPQAAQVIASSPPAVAAASSASGDTPATPSSSAAAPAKEQQQKASEEVDLAREVEAALAGKTAEKAAEQASAPKTAAPAAGGEGAAAEGAGTAAATAGEEKADKEDEGAAEEDAADDDASFLIEASITLDDGSVQVARVGARDRCKDVAARFVREHSLKAWFEDPLVRYLKKVEAEAERFPVEVSAELLNIRKEFSKK